MMITTNVQSNNRLIQMSKVIRINAMSLTNCGPFDEVIIHSRKDLV